MKEHLFTPDANLKRRRSLSERLNDPDWIESDAKRAQSERARRAQRKRKQAEILRKLERERGHGS